MPRWPICAVATAALTLLVGCTAITNTAYSNGPVASPATTRGSSVQGTITPASVNSYLTAVSNGDLASALASVDDSGESPAAANTAENVYLFLGSGEIRLQDWRLAGTAAANDGGQWIFVVCQLTLTDGSAREVPLTFHTNRVGKLVFVG